jgi:hypothetical protein
MNFIKINYLAHDTSCAQCSLEHEGRLSESCSLRAQCVVEEFFSIYVE